MRGIKFRGWAKVYEKWVYGYYVKFSNMHYIRSVDVYGYEDLYQVDPKSVGQYTECKSVEGEDIYEGDIINLFLEIAAQNLVLQVEDQLP